jgi:hypothetical protein
MRRSTAIAALLATVIVLSGCSGTFGNGTSTPTVTPAEVPPVESTEALAPGLTEAGIDDPVALVGAHERVLRNASYTVSADIDERFASGELRRRKAANGQYAAGTTPYRLRVELAGTALPEPVPYRTTVWSDGERGLKAVTRNDTTRYLAVRDLRPGFAGSRTLYALGPAEENNLQSLFAAADRGTVERIERNTTGPARYRITTDRFSRPNLSAIRPPTAIESAAFSAVVDSRGIIREYRLEYSGEIDGRPVHGVERVRFTDIGTTTVERPPWSDEALNGSRSESQTNLASLRGRFGTSRP